MAITLANTQSALVSCEVALSLALQAHISPSITSSANLLAVTNTTSSTPARTYCWTHGINRFFTHIFVAYFTHLTRQKTIRLAENL
jgi:hypothetical protein